MRISKKRGGKLKFQEWILNKNIKPLKNYKSNLTNFVKVSLRRFHEEFTKFDYNFVWFIHFALIWPKWTVFQIADTFQKLNLYYSSLPGIKFNNSNPRASIKCMI